MQSTTIFYDDPILILLCILVKIQHFEATGEWGQATSQQVKLNKWFDTYYLI